MEIFTSCKEALADAEAALAASAEHIKAKDAALRHARTFIENRFSMLSPEQRSTVDHINAALDAIAQTSREDRTPEHERAWVLSEGALGSWDDALQLYTTSLGQAIELTASAARIEALTEALNRLLKAAKTVQRYGAQRGPQWTDLSLGIVGALAVLDAAPRSDGRPAREQMEDPHSAINKTLDRMADEAGLRRDLTGPAAPRSDGDRPLTEKEVSFIDAAWERHKAAAPPLARTIDEVK